MKFTFSIKTLALASVMSLGMLAPANADDDETPLGKQMETLSGSLKKLRKAETTEEKVALVLAAQAATIKTLAYLPMIFKDLKDEKEKAKATSGYKMLVGQTYVKLCELEMAYLAGDEDKADEIKGQLKDLKKEGHEKYTE
ncbi:MAG: hypothetical protein ACJAT6_000053 [Akkermansiaceae bacterium]|jgi:hypothetical protein|tara:strand:- start:8168 stop:8590 length:423 start_codon:yes stop_codon:yes gene_type:complete